MGWPMAASQLTPVAEKAHGLGENSAHGFLDQQNKCPKVHKNAAEPISHKLV
jgi:hypothetical protein